MNTFLNWFSGLSMWASFGFLMLSIVVLTAAIILVLHLCGVEFDEADASSTAVTNMQTTIRIMQSIVK